MIEIYESSPEELQDALAVHEAAFAKHHATYNARPADAAQQAARLLKGVRLVAREEETIAGAVQYADHSEHLHILGLAVHPSFQNRGIARQLIDQVAGRAARLGFARLVTDTIEETGNVDFFEHLGFKTIDRSVIDQFESDLHEVLHRVKLERSLAT
jgi:ribosomal protein S18 acetylase RimI-like enzyme